MTRSLPCVGAQPPARRLLKCPDSPRPWAARAACTKTLSGLVAGCALGMAWGLGAGVASAPGLVLALAVMSLLTTLAVPCAVEWGTALATTPSEKRHARRLMGLVVLATLLAWGLVLAAALGGVLA